MLETFFATFFTVFTGERYRPGEHRQLARQFAALLIGLSLVIIALCYLKANYGVEAAAWLAAHFEH